MRHSSRIVLVVFILFLSFETFTRAGSREVQECRRMLPPNVEMPAALEEIVAGIYATSSTFRAQCARVAASRTLRVSIRTGGTMRSACRAYTNVRRRGREIVAEVHVPSRGVHVAELIGHEFEHVLEQVEGLDLRALSRTRGSGVYQVDHDLFETVRAQRVGRIVADEVRGRKAD